MNLHLSRFHQRLPRYILRTQDNTMIRVAGPNQTPWEEGTEIKNLSLSGLAFTAPSELCPLVGEHIKIQFEIPGSKQMACYGSVVRIENINSSTRLIAIQFEKLESAHRLFLLQGLAKKLKEQHREEEKQRKKLMLRRLLNNRIGFAIALISLIIWASIFYSSLKINWIQQALAILN